MEQCRVNVLMDKNIKTDAERLFNQMGLNLTSAINIFFRQTLREQAMPFEVKPYDDYYCGATLDQVCHSLEQANKGQFITKTFAELEEMGDEE